MRVALVLLIGLFLTAAPLVTVQAEENQAPSGQSAANEEAAEENSADREAFAKSLFEGRCQMCHQLPEPGMLTPKQWKLILTTMQQRMQQAKVPPLTEDETARLLEYLTPRAR